MKREEKKQLPKEHSFFKKNFTECSFKEVGDVNCGPRNHFLFPPFGSWALTYSSQLFLETSLAEYSFLSLFSRPGIVSLEEELQDRNHQQSYPFLGTFRSVPEKRLVWWLGLKPGAWTRKAPIKT